MGFNYKQENWFFNYWRPAMAWSYLVVCMFDFLIAPILLGLYCYFTHTPMIMWNPITLQGGAVYHASMGAVCGVTAWSRGKEKIAVLQSGGSNILIADDDVTTTTTQVANTPPQPAASTVTTMVRRQGSDE